MYVYVAQTTALYKCYLLLLLSSKHNGNGLRNDLPVIIRSAFFLSFLVMASVVNVIREQKKLGLTLQKWLFVCFDFHEKKV